MKQHHFNQSKLSDVMTFEEAAEMEKLYYISQKNFPYPIPFIKRYSSGNGKANLITTLIIHYIKFTSGQAERINTQGNYRNGKWTTSGATKGSADISAIIKGKSVKIEVKTTDKQSEAQKKYQEAVEAAGGIYLLVHSFSEFMDKIKTISL